MKHVPTTDKLPAPTEKQFLAFVTDLAQLGQWLIYHTYDSRRSQAGFPDLVLTRNGHIIFAELKSQKGRVRPNQQMWIDELSKSGEVDVYLWRPSDEEDIKRILLGQRLLT